jgi:hypothetical protein
MNSEVTSELTITILLKKEREREGRKEIYTAVNLEQISLQMAPGQLWIFTVWIM